MFLDLSEPLKTPYLVSYSLCFVCMLREHTWETRQCVPAFRAGSYEQEEFPPLSLCMDLCIAGAADVRFVVLRDQRADAEHTHWADSDQGKPASAVLWLWFRSKARMNDPLNEWKKASDIFWMFRGSASLVGKQTIRSHTIVCLVVHPIHILLGANVFALSKWIVWSIKNQTLF